MTNREEVIEVPEARKPPETASVRMNEDNGRSSTAGGVLGPKELKAASVTTYEFIDSRELARRLTVATPWVRDQVRARSQDPLPHVNLGKYVRFLWGSPALEMWIGRRIVVGNNRRLGRTQRKE